MYGVYYINSGDAEWSLLSVKDTLEDANTLMRAFAAHVAKAYKTKPYCTAVSKGRTEDNVPRGELKALTQGGHDDRV